MGSRDSDDIGQAGTIMKRQRQLHDMFGNPLPRFAPVCGVQMYEQMAIQNKLGNYHLLLAHDIYARPERYRNVFQNLSPNLMTRRIVILDNSVTELGTAIADPDYIRGCAHTVGANVIVLPDVYKDAVMTVDSCRDAYEKWEPLMSEALGESIDDWCFMIVPQGKTKEEFAWCAEQFADKEKFPRIQYWGIPRNLVELHGTRKYGLDICRLLNRSRRIHMLGFSDSIVDDILTVRDNYGRYNLTGIDSAVPVRADVEGKRMSLGLTIGKRPEGWLENAVFNEAVWANIQRTEALIRG